MKTEIELKEWYSNRELITFVQGKDYFNNIANKYFKQFIYEKNSSPFDEDFYRILWEVENGYGE